VVGVGEESDQGIRQGVLNGVSRDRLDVGEKDSPELEEANSLAVEVILRLRSAPRSVPERKALVDRASMLANVSGRNPTALE